MPASPAHLEGREGSPRLSVELASRQGEAAVSPQPWLRDDSLATGVVLSACAGLLDAFSYLGHGHAFASFMTGNLVLLGIHLASDGTLAIYILPLAAYVVGTAIARGMGREEVRHLIGGRPTLVALAIEAAVLTGLALVPFTLKNRVLVSLITMAAAVQNTSFRLIGRRTYNSAFMTGNLQTFSTLLADGLLPFSAAKLRESLDLGAVIAGFFAGAFAGGVLTPRLHVATLMVPAGALALLGLALLLPKPAPAAGRGLP